MSLRDRLQNIKERSAQRLPEEAKEVMRRATRQLAKSGQVEKVLGPGEKLPSFSLKTQEGKIISSADLLSRVPLVLQFYRGYW